MTGPVNELQPVTTWMRDDCQCRVVSPDGDGCALTVDYTTGLCAHCQGHAFAATLIPARDGALDVRRVVQAITNIAMRHGLAKDPPLVEPQLAHIYGYSRATPDMDAEIAAEYAALGAVDPPAEEGS